MNYERPPERLASLADEYVLGTLPPRARRRFERALETSAAARAAVRLAEDRLAPLNRRLDPVEPAPETWNAIARRLGFPEERAPAPRTFRDSWRLALAAAIVGLALGIGWLVLREQPPALADVASLRAEGGPELWVIATDASASTLQARATPAVRAEPGRSFELWALPEGAAPVSLGLLPASGDVERSLTEAQRAALGVATKVAVSLEPSGGSTTGAPTGPVLYVAELRRVSS